MLREVKYIVVHCTRTPIEVEAEIIRDSMKENNRRPMYHGMINRQGEFFRLMGCNLTADISYPENESCYHIAVVGGVRGEKSCDTRSPIQHHALYCKLLELQQLFPEAKVIGADYFLGKQDQNPGFAVEKWLAFHRANTAYWIDYEEDETGEWIFVE